MCNKLTFHFSECFCSLKGSENSNCSSSGQCNCKIGFTGTHCNGCATGYTGSNCDRCLPGYTGYPNCASMNSIDLPNHYSKKFTALTLHISLVGKQIHNFMEPFRQNQFSPNFHEL